jgi:Na+/glutamate symporter
MSGHGFHVHGPHDHELEHAQKGAHGGHGDEGSGMINQIAMFTAIIATIGAIFGYMGGATQANAGLYKNNAAIKKTEASNQWNYFQSKSTKQSLAEMSRDLAAKRRRQGQVPVQGGPLRKGKDRDQGRGGQARVAEATEWDHKSDAQMHQHHRWAQSTTVLQVCIALAAIALLTKKKWLEYAMFGAGAVGLAVGAMAALHI